MNLLETRGRKAKIYPQEEIENIIYRFTQEEKVSGWIKYSEVYRFANKLYENGEISYKLSEDFWRREGRQGKETIDKINKVYESTLINKRTSNIDLYVDTEECVDKFFTGKPSDKKRLIDALKINEKKAKDSTNLLIKIDTLKEEISRLKEEKKDLEQSLDQYQMILFSWFNSSVKSDVPLINLMTTGKSRHPIIDLFFETAFSNPAEGYNEFEKYRKNSRVNDNTMNKDNVVTPLRKSRLQTVIEKYNNDEKE